MSEKGGGIQGNTIQSLLLLLYINCIALNTPILEAEREKGESTNEERTGKMNRA